MPAWAAWVADLHRPRRWTATRVPLAAAWLAALALVTWSNRWAIAAGEKRWPTPATDAQVKWPSSAPAEADGVDGADPAAIGGPRLTPMTPKGADPGGAIDALLVDGPAVGRGHGQRLVAGRPGPPPRSPARPGGRWMAVVRASTLPPTAFPSTETTTSPAPDARRLRPGPVWPPTGLTPWICDLVGVGHADEGQQGPQQHEGHQEVHGRAGHRHQQPGVERLAPGRCAPRRPGSTSSRLVIPGIFT